MIRKNSIFILFFIIIILLAAVFYFYQNKFKLVVVRINNEEIYLSDYNNYIKALTNFYNLRKKILKDNSEYQKLKLIDIELKFQENLEKNVLQEMIENKIIELELKNQFNISNLNNVANQKINKALSESKNIEENIKFLYNIDLETFKRLFLYPAALKEILNDELKNTKIGDLNQWFLKAKQKYSIKIYLNNLEWNKEKGEVE